MVTLTVSPHDIIDSVKAMLQADVGIPPKQLHLNLDDNKATKGHGKKLRDNRRISDYEICHNNVLRLAYRMLRKQKAGDPPSSQPMRIPVASDDGKITVITPSGNTVGGIKLAMQLESGTPAASINLMLGGELPDGTCVHFEDDVLISDYNIVDGSTFRVAYRKWKGQVASGPHSCQSVTTR